jgi:hypothetical protein
MMTRGTIDHQTPMTDPTKGEVEDNNKNVFPPTIKPKKHNNHPTKQRRWVRWDVGMWHRPLEADNKHGLGGE